MAVPDFNAAVAETIKQAMKNLEKLGELLESVDTSKIEITDSKSVYNLSNSLAGTARVIADLERASRERGVLVTEAAELLKLELRRLFAERPDLLEECSVVLGLAEQRLMLPAKRGRPRKIR